MKLAINEPGDEYEREADRISEQVMRMPEPRLQRPCTRGGTSGGLAQTAAPGQPLDPVTRAFMEPRFGHDFSRVRVHTGENVSASAKALGALAYVRGSDMFFGAGQYAPHTYEGCRLLSHELAHVLQRQFFIPQSGTAGQHDSAAELEPQPAASRADAIQLKRESDAKPAQPALITVRRGDTDRIEDAYGAGSLDQSEWGERLKSAQQALARGQIKQATEAYRALYQDVAKLAQATRIVESPGNINEVHGTQNDCKDAKPGLNLSMSTSSEWGANGTTGYVDLDGKFGVARRGRGKPQPSVAIVLSRSAFMLDKGQTLGILRHEMMHAELDSEDAAAAFLSNPRDKKAPVPSSLAKSELLAHVEGFMTMFHLAPAPASFRDPPFMQLLGALTTRKVLPWAKADGPARSEALGRLQEYYCHAMDAPHRRAFEGWVNYYQVPRRIENLILDDKVGTELAVAQAKDQNDAMEDDFFQGLKSIIRSQCKGITTPMKL